MSSTWNNGNIKLSVFGESHGKAIGVVLDNLPSGIEIDEEYIYSFMARRAPGKNNKISTSRLEKDFPEILSGVYNNKTTGTPLCAVIQNTNTKSSDYSDISHFARPGHADFTGFVRYNGFNDVRGGGHFSGRLTAPLVFAGAICGLILRKHKIFTAAHIMSIHNEIFDIPFNNVELSNDLFTQIKTKKIPVIDDSISERIENIIDSARINQDSVGGIIECSAINLPAGLGSPMFDGVENIISSLIFGIPAVKGIEFGAGFTCSSMFGSENNDEFYIDENGDIKTRTNNHGGILGGITSGMPLIFRVAMKPTPSISRSQKTIDYIKNKETKLNVKGRHDPCVAIRAVPVVEACTNIAIASLIL